MSTAVAYIRVSTNEQHHGPEAQREDIRRWAAREGVDVVAWHEDLGVSGGAMLDKRPGLLAAFDSIRETGAAQLVVAKRDRLARDVPVLVMVERVVEKSGAVIVSAAGEGTGDSPADLLMRRMVDAFAEYERQLIKARTRAALAVKKRKGERVGQVPFGYRLGADGVHLEEHPAEQRVVAIVEALRADGMSIRAIAAHLNADDVPARGKRWHPTTVARLLKQAA
jgi:site-specific DNA recombinase